MFVLADGDRFDPCVFLFCFLFLLETLRLSLGKTRFRSLLLSVVWLLSLLLIDPVGCCCCCRCSCCRRCVVAVMVAVVCV